MVVVTTDAKVQKIAMLALILILMETANLNSNVIKFTSKMTQTNNNYKILQYRCQRELDNVNDKKKETFGESEYPCTLRQTALTQFFDELFAIRIIAGEYLESNGESNGSRACFAMTNVRFDSDFVTPIGSGRDATLHDTLFSSKKG